jgi:bifunctional pyridoxal-dependent enzyme with beta-cystathionase and maltose regulon repressor activities
MDLIWCNETETLHCKWLTLTYADAMTEKVYEDGKMFLRRLQQYLNHQTDFSASTMVYKIGRGIQYLLQESVEYLLNAEVIRRIN